MPTQAMRPRFQINIRNFPNAEAIQNHSFLIIDADSSYPGPDIDVMYSRLKARFPAGAMTEYGIVESSSVSAAP